jgi:NDP-sugar pyrophosphorylase family protein/aminoglycoside/choline kinase family phosphotransferase
MNPINIFILAAGLGERLRPITNHIPKPLIPVLGKPVLESVLERVSALPIHKIGINLHHESNMIENWLKQSAFSTMVEFFPEDPILGTGGALKNAGGFLRKSAFLVHNSDIISDIDLEKLIDFHLSSKNLVTLAVHDYQEFNKLVLDENGFLKEIVRNHPHPNPPFSKGKEVGENAPPSPGGRGLGGWGKFLAFTGIAVYSPEFLKFLPQGASSVVDAWLKAVQHGYKIGTLDVTGCYWSDIGTPVSYVKAVINELRKNAEMVWIHPSVIGCKNIEMDGYVVIEEVSNPPSPPFSKGGKGGFFGANIPHKVISLRNCIMLPGTKIDMQEDTPPSPPLGKGGMEGVLYENCILGPGFRIDLSKSEMLGLSPETDSFLIGTGGSDRKYYRVKSKGRSVVLVQCHDKDPDFQRHVEYTRFFKKYSIPVPELVDVNPDKKSAIFEDLGDLSLYSWLKCPRGEDQIVEMYKRVIDILILIHTTATEHVSDCPLLKNRIFDYEHLRWETGYFMERFVEGVRNIKVNNLLTLNDEFHRLALKVGSFRKTVIHRDFQSQNIMITRGTPRLVDYQGARIGPPAYDLASILWDPYHPIDDDSRERLLNYYINEVSKFCSGKHLMKTNPPSPPLLKGGKGGLPDNGDIFFNEIEFKSALLPCRLQRHMQALGAYGFLSKIKGKKYFMKYVPEGLRLLKEDVFLSRDEYPKLYDLTMRL